MGTIDSLEDMDEILEELGDIDGVEDLGDTGRDIEIEEEIESNTEEVFDNNMKDDIRQYATKYLAILIQQKSLKDDLKMLKMDYESKGVPCSVIQKVITNLKKIFNKSDGELQEEEFMKEWLLKDKDIIAKIDVLNTKNI